MSGRRFGFECELTSGAQSVINALNAEGLAGMASLHSYHCDCDDCHHNDVERDGGYLFRGQNDCTVDGEIISSILTHGADSAERAFTKLPDVLRRMRADVDTDAGFHVHVDKTDLNNVSKLRLYRIFMRYQTNDLAELASARESSVREYNRPVPDNFFASNRSLGETYYVPSSGRACYLHEGARPSLAGMCQSACCADLRRDLPEAQAEWDRLYGASMTSTPSPFWTDDTFRPTNPPKGMWLNGHGAGGGDRTFEFRLWNATRVEWRMRLAVGVSVAMVDAAKAGVNVTQNDERPLEEVLDPFLSDDTWSGILRQRSFKEA